MGNTLYLECSSGISGDMAVAALLDLGADEEVLRKAVHSLPVDGFSIEISRVKKSGLEACDFLVRLDAEHENHDHDMEYLHGKHTYTHGTEPHIHGDGSHTQEGERHIHEDGSHTQEGERHIHGDGSHTQEGEHHIHGDGSHTHEREHHIHEESSHVYGADHHSHGEEFHTHESGHHCHEGGHSHVHRGLKEVMEIIGHAELTPRARETAEQIFSILAEAEAKAHGVPLEQVHFHEVGAVDSIVDIVAAAVCLDNLDITEVIVPRICEGQGFVRCQHGVIPVPVPAVVNIAQLSGLNLHLTDTEGELVTPTGAAIVAAVKTSDCLPESFTIRKTGMGAGKRTYERPSLLRAMLIDSTPADQKDFSGNAGGRDTIYRLETNIDDCTGESLGYVMKRLFKAGAKDVHYIPVYMKKNRPAYQLNVICDKESVSKMENIIFRETTTIGIRRMEMERTVLERSEIRVRTSLGEAEVKVCILPDGEKRYYPEYASVKRLAGRHGISYQDAFEKIKREVAGK